MTPFSVELVPATREDIPALARLWMAAFPAKFGHIFGGQAQSFLEEWLTADPIFLQGTTLAKVDGIVRGYIQVEDPMPVSGLRHTVTQCRHDLPIAWRLFHTARPRFGVLSSLRILLRLAVLDQRPVRDTALYIHMLGVDADCRGMGIGSHLLAFAADHARAKGLDALTLGVVHENTGAIRLYERHGFTAGPVHASRCLQWACGSHAYLAMTKRLTEAG